jgi:hypothetical protein
MFTDVRPMIGNRPSRSLTPTKWNCHVQLDIITESVSLSYINLLHTSNSIEWKPFLPSTLILEARLFQPLVYFGVALASHFLRIELFVDLCSNLRVLTSIAHPSLVSLDTAGLRRSQTENLNSIMASFLALETKKAALASSIKKTSTPIFQWPSDPRVENGVCFFGGRGVYSLPFLFAFL